MPYAQQVSARTGLDPRLVLSQAALETGWGRSAPNNNFFGIKSHGQAGGSSLMTQEFQNGQMVSIPQSFRGYESPEQSFQGYADFILNNPRYQGVLSQGDLAGQIEAMGQSGYATDPEYANKLASIAARFGGDTPRGVAADTRSALGLGQQNTQLSTRGPLAMPSPQQPTATPFMPPRERPQGILQSLGIQPEGEGPQGDRPFYQRDQFRDTMGNIAIAANSLRQRPDDNLQRAVMGNRQRREANRTAEWLAQQEGGAEFAQMISSGANPAEVLMAYRQSRQPAQVDQTAAMQNYQFLLAQGVAPAEAMERAFSGGGVNVTVGGEAPRPELLGTQGLVAIPDSSVEGGWRVEPAPGSPLAREAEAEAAAGAAGVEQQAAGAVNVLEVLEGLEADVAGDPFLTGMLGSIARNVPGTGAYDAERTSQTIKANLAFDALAAMRAASPTGGALGAVSERELALLESQISSLDLGQRRETVLENIERIRDQYKRILETAYKTGDPAALDAALGGRPSFLGGGGGGQGTEELSDDDLLKLYLGNN